MSQEDRALTLSDLDKDPLKSLWTQSAELLDYTTDLDMEPLTESPYMKPNPDTIARSKLPRLRSRPNDFKAKKTPFSYERKDAGEFACELKGCRSPVFRRLQDLKRHWRGVHKLDSHLQPAVLFSCPWKGCAQHERGFTRKDNFISHLRRCHNSKISRLLHSSGTEDHCPALPGTQSSFTAAQEYTNPADSLPSLGTSTDLSQQNSRSAEAGCDSDLASSVPSASAGDSGADTITSQASTSECTDSELDTELVQLIRLTSLLLVQKYLDLTNEAPGSTKKHYNGGKQSQCPRKDDSQRTSDGGSGSRRGKGLANQPGDMPEDGNPRAPKRRNVGIETSDAVEVQLLACPFNKYDNRLFGSESPNESYHACATCSFVHIGHLKQHLKRNHYMPSYYCFRCCRQDFSSHASVAAHMREEPICTVLDPPLNVERIGIDMIEKLGLDRKNPPGTDRVEYWFKLYNAFFPGAIELRQPSPYYDGPAAECLNRFLAFTSDALPTLLPISSRALNLSDELSTSESLRLVQDIQQEAMQRYLRTIEHGAMPRLGYPVPLSLARRAIEPTNAQPRSLHDLLNPDLSTHDDTSELCAMQSDHHSPPTHDHLHANSDTYMPNSQLDTRWVDREFGGSRIDTVTEPSPRNVNRDVFAREALESFYPQLDTRIDWQAELDQMLQSNWESDIGHDGKSVFIPRFDYAERGSHELEL